MDVYKFSFQAMATRNEIVLYAKSLTQATEAALAAEKEVKRIERTYSRYLPDSILTQINNNAGIKKSPINKETFSLLNYANACYIESEGLFDITSGVLRKAWDFKKYILPTDNQIKEILPLVDWLKVDFSETEIYLPMNNMELDFGGIGKEYAADRAAMVLMNSGIKHGLVSLGGDLHAIGPKPDGEPWTIHIAHPRESDNTIDEVTLYKGGLATSGDYERFIKINNKRYHHILNPKTGWPVEDTLQSVTVISESSTVAGSSASIAMLMGNKKGMDWLECHFDKHLVIDNSGLITKNF